MWLKCWCRQSSKERNPPAPPPPPPPPHTPTPTPTHTHAHTPTHMQTLTSLQVHLQQLQHHSRQRVLGQVLRHRGAQLTHQLLLLPGGQPSTHHGGNHGRYPAGEPLGHAACQRKGGGDVAGWA
jgi:hypothetical protein